MPTEGTGAGRRRPRCCRWARTGPHRWERDVECCGGHWWLLYWVEKGGGDKEYAHCACGHTIGCHQRTRRECPDCLQYHGRHHSHFGEPVTQEEETAAHA